MSRHSSRSRATTVRSRAPPIPIPGRRNDVRSLISHFEERSKYSHIFTPPRRHHHHHHRHAEPLPVSNTVRVLVDCFNRMVAAISMRPIGPAATRSGSSNSSAGYRSRRSVYEPTVKRYRSTNRYPPPSSRAHRSPDHFHSLGRSSKYSGDKDMLDPGPVPRVILTPPPQSRFSRTLSPHEGIMAQRDVEVSRILEHYEKMERAASPPRSDHLSHLPGVNLKTGRVVGTGEIVGVSVSHLKDHFEPKRRWYHDTGNRTSRLPNASWGRRSHTDFHRHNSASNESREMKWQRRDRDTGKSRQSPMPGTFPSCLETKDSIPIERSATTRNHFNCVPVQADNIPRGANVDYTAQSCDSSSRPRTYLDIAQDRRRAKSSGSFTSADTVITARDVPPSPYQSIGSHRRSPSSRRSRHNRNGSFNHYHKSSSEKSNSPQHGNSDSSSDEESRKRTPSELELHGSNHRPPSPIRSPGLMVQLGILPLERRTSIPSQQYDVPRMRVRPDNTWLRQRHPVDILDPPLLRRSNRSPHHGSMDGVSDVDTSPRTLTVTTVISSDGDISGPYHQPKFQSMNIFPDHDAFGQLHGQRVHLEHSQRVPGLDGNDLENAMAAKNHSLAEQRSMESMATALEIQSQGFDDQESLSASSLSSSQSFNLRHNPASTTSPGLYFIPDRGSTSVKSDKLRARSGTPYSNESSHSHPRFHVSPSTPSSAVSAENDKQHQFALLTRSHSREGRDSAQIRLRRIDEKARNDGKGKDKKRLGWMKWW